MAGADKGHNPVLDKAAGFWQPSHRLSDHPLWNLTHTASDSDPCSPACTAQKKQHMQLSADAADRPYPTRHTLTKEPP